MIKSSINNAGEDAKVQLPQFLGDFSSSVPPTFGAEYFLVVGDCPVHCRVLAASLGSTHYRLLAPPRTTRKNVSRYCQMFGEGGGTSNITAM
jgi:hypothetical protein